MGTPGKTETYSIGLELTEQHIAILGKVGSGKTVTAKGYVEKLLELDRRTLIWDPTGVWWGLRYRPDGRPAFRIAHVGGEFGDFAVSKDDGERLGRYVAECDHPIIVDTSEMLIGQKHTFAAAFFRALYDANRRPLYMIVDEADEVAPQNPMKDAKVCLHQVDRIIRRGRVRGFRATLITQRPAVLHKNVLSQANTLIAMRLTSSHDRDAMKAWIQGQADLEEGKRILAAVPKLGQGEGYIWSPEFELLERVRFPMCQTFDSSRTPKFGEEPVRPPEDYVDLEPAATWQDLAALLAHENDPPKPAKKHAGKAPRTTSSPAAARDREEEVGRQIAQAANASHRKGLEQGFEKGYAAAASTLTGAVRGIIQKAEEFLEELRAIAKRLGEAERGHIEDLEDRLEQLAKFEEAEAVAERIGKPARVNATDGNGEVPVADLFAPWLRTLKVLAQRHPARFTVKDWAALAGMKASGGGWGQHMKALRERELIEIEDGLYRCTPAGLAAAGAVEEQATTPEEIRVLWADKLGSRAGDILAIAARNPNGIHKDELAAYVEMTPSGGAFQRNLRQLRQNGLVRVDRGFVYPAEIIL